MADTAEIRMVGICFAFHQNGGVLSSIWKFEITW